MAYGQRTIRKRFPGGRRPRLTRAARTAAAALALVSAAACRRNGGFRVTQGTAPAIADSGSPEPARSAAAPALTPAEGRAVREFLAGRPGWRIAGDVDAHPSDDADDVSRLYGVYHPYVVRGDIDDDGVIDFVAAFVQGARADSGNRFAVVAFCGDGRGGYRPGQLIESDVALERGDLSIDRDSIVITPDLSDDDSSRRYRWNTMRRRFELVEDDDQPDRPPSTRV